MGRWFPFSRLKDGAPRSIGHGESERPDRDFGDGGLVDVEEAVIERSKGTRVIPVSTAHAGWVALELRRQLGERIEKLVLLDWLVLEPPAPFLEGFGGLQSPDHWKQVRYGLFSVRLNAARIAITVWFCCLGGSGVSYGTTQPARLRHVPRALRRGARCLSRNSRGSRLGSSPEASYAS